MQQRIASNELIDTGNLDTSDFLIKLMLIFHWRHLIIRAMLTPVIIKHSYVIKNIAAGFFPGSVNPVLIQRENRIMTSTSSMVSATTLPGSQL